MDRTRLIAMLGWYVEAGADETILDAPVNRFHAAGEAPPAAGGAPEERAARQPDPRDAVEPRRIARPPESRLSPLQTPANPDEPAAPGPMRADALRDVTSIADLERRVASFEGCALRFTATNTVFGAGAEKPPLMLIGEAPGAEEDRQGLPFVGPSGRLLDRMLRAIGLERPSVYVTNTLYWRPPGNRTPTPQEVNSCMPFLQRQIELVDPRVLVLLGGPAAKRVLDRTEGIMRLRGRWFQYTTGAGHSIPVMSTFHPAYLLRSPAQKREAWRDLLAVKARLADVGGGEAGP